MIVLMMLFGAGIVYLFLQYLYRKRWNSKLDVDVKFAANYTMAGESAEIVEKITNAKRLPLPYINMKFTLDHSMRFAEDDSNSTVSDYTYRNDVFSLWGNQRITRKVPVICTKRGVYKIDSAEVVSTGIFMNDICVAKFPIYTEITVYPKQADASRIEIPYSKILGTLERNSYRNEDRFLFRGIREYQTFDTMNMINWNATARAGELMVNQFNESISQEVCILLNLEPAGATRIDAVAEESISVAAGLASMLLQQGISVSVFSNGRDYVTGEAVQLTAQSGAWQFNEIHTALARVDLNQEMESFAKMLEKHIPDSHLYVMISANTRSDLQEILQEHRKDAATLWIAPYLAGEERPQVQFGIEMTDWEVAL